MKLTRTAFFLFLLLLLLKMPADASIDLLEDTIDGVNVKVISIDLTDRRVCITPEVKLGLPFDTESLQSFLCRKRPVAAINGTYFNMETSTPVGEITIAGKKVNSSGIGTVFALTTDRKACFFDAKRQAKVNRKCFEMTLGAGPRLLEKGKICHSFSAEGFRDKNILRPASRSAIAISFRKHLYLAVSFSAIDLDRWARTLWNLGCSDAMNLDGGSSVAMSYRGVVLASPARPLSNFIAVYYRD